MYFAYGEEETDYLKKKDKRMAEVIDRIGHVERKVDTDLFSAVVHHIVGQQISTKAQETIWQRMLSALGEVNAETVLAAGVSKLQSLGMTFRKAEYITDFAEKIHTGAFDLEGIWQKSDEEAIRELSSLKGIGVWTAEMILLNCAPPPAPPTQRHTGFCQSSRSSRRPAASIKTPSPSLCPSRMGSPSAIPWMAVCPMKPRRSMTAL